jgi:hypothetical protein
MLSHFYALLCDAERIKKLLEEGTDPNIRDGDGNTPLHFAASKGCAEVARLLLKHGADPNAQDKSGETPLHLAASEGRVDVVRLLLERGADPNAKNEGGETPLHYAAYKGHFDVVRLLLERGADPTVKNKDGATPLDIARARGNDGVVSLIEEFHIERWLGRRREPSRPGAAPVRSASNAVCEACCEAWRIISQVYDHVKEARTMTRKELEDLEGPLRVFKGHVNELEKAAAEVFPDAVNELVTNRQLIESILSQLNQGNLPPETIENITSVYVSINRLLKEKLACRCELYLLR